MTTADFAVNEMFLRVDGGLGNRIRPVLSALFISHKLKIPATFDWGVGPGCWCPADLLFENRIQWTEFPGPYLYYRANRRGYEFLLEMALRKQRIVKLKSPVFFEPFHRCFPGEAGPWIATNFDHYFAPLPPLLDKIHSFAQEHALGQALGVHVRRGDKVGRVRTLPSLEAYFQAVDRALTGDTHIFLATDDGRDESESFIVQRFVQRYGKRLVYRAKGGVGRRQIGIQDAVVDLWLLRSCGSFVGTQCSTFSETAAIGRQATLI